MGDDTRRVDDEIKRTWRSGGPTETTSVGLADPDTTDPDTTDSTDTGDADTTDTTDTGDTTDSTDS